MEPTDSGTRAKVSSTDVAYYRRRMEAERERARTATNPATAQLHGELADLYQKMIEVFEAPASRTS